MKCRFFSSPSPVLSVALAAAVLAGISIPVSAQSKKAEKSKTSAAPKAPAKSPGAATKYDQHLEANMKLLNVLSRYAEVLAGATDAAAATLAVPRIEAITKEAITAAESIVKLGRPAPDLEAKLARNADIEMTARLVAEQTRSAVKAVSANSGVKSILAPAIESFQTALNRIQQTADAPAGTDDPAKKAPEKESAPKTEPAATVPASPESAPAPTGDSSAPAPAAEETPVPPPPPPDR